MINPSSFFTRARKFVLIFGITLLIASLASIVFVAARNKGQEVAAPPLRLTEDSVKADITARYGKLQLSFEVNAGQSDQSVKFLSHGPGYDLFLTSTEAVLTLRKPQTTPVEKLRALPSPADQPTTTESSVLRLKMIGANSGSLVEDRMIAGRLTTSSVMIREMARKYSYLSQGSLQRDLPGDRLGLLR